MKLPNIIPTILIISAILILSANGSNIFANSSLVLINLSTPNKLSGGERSNGKFEIQRTEENKNQELKFKLSTNNPSLIRFETTDITLAPGKDIAEFRFSSSETQIKTSASIKVQLTGSNEQGETENYIEVFPALLKGIFVQPSMTGTHGAKVSVSVELKAPAPSGGIQIYLSPLYVADIGSYEFTIPTTTIQFPAGQTKIGFSIDYDQIREEGKKISDINEITVFNQQKRNVEFVVALDPQNVATKSKWATIPNMAIGGKFTVNPLQVSTISVEPQAITGGNEALGTFTLNLAPGDSEKIYFKPPRIGGGQKLWVVPTGSSCSETPATFGSLEIPLTQGVTNYNLKVCTATVSAAQTINIQAILRSGKKEIGVRVQP